MRGENAKQSSMLMLMSPETRVPATHPLRAIKKLPRAAHVDAAHHIVVVVRHHVRVVVALLGGDVGRTERATRVAVAERAFVVRSTRGERETDRASPTISLKPLNSAAVCAPTPASMSRRQTARHVRQRLPDRKSAIRVAGAMPLPRGFAMPGIA
ncbi:MAG: hypothetical protein ACRENE_03400 [Polyangiaceae bacterium]